MQYRCFEIEDRKSTILAIFCRDDHGRVRFQPGNYIGNCMTLLAETLAIREAIMKVIKDKLYEVIIKRYSKVTIRDRRAS